MKTLFLVRHGKSSWHYPELDDMARPLKNRGEKDAHLMGELLREKGITADKILSSPAKRAMDTAIIFAEELRYDDHVKMNEFLYMQGTKAIMDIVKSTPDEVNTLFIFGHNPDMLNLANAINGSEYENVPTAGVLCVDYDLPSWNEVATHNGTVRFLDYPSLHKDKDKS